MLTEYFGFMVSELDGSVENLYGNFGYKPRTERCGFAYAKWFENEEERDGCKEYTKKVIKEIQENGHKGLRVKR